ncbi:MAG: hypothetical protein FGM46_03935 [Ferruginibacter sp.]|nr:hypothetical protein [Ferruginibacter sp.]
MLFINFNGKILDATTPIIEADNRGLRYGDGLFETMKYSNGKILQSKEHLERLWEGMYLMEFDLPKLFSKDFLLHQIIALTEKNKHSFARVRVTIFRGNGGLYDAANHHPHYIIQSWPLPESNLLLNENGLELMIYKDAIKNIDRFSNCKHNNYLPYVMGAIAAKKNKCNDAILLNNKGNICDSTVANIFIIKGNTISTPALSEGCVAGIMRTSIILCLQTIGETIIEREINESELWEADEIFLTNSITPIKWVATFQNKSYGNAKIKQLFHSLFQTKRELFC